MTDNIDNVIKSEKAKAARSERKLKILTCTDAGMAQDMAEIFVDARGSKYSQGADGKIRHNKSQVEMLTHLQTKVKENRPTFFGIAAADGKTKTITDPARLELEALAFQLGNMTARGKLVKQIGESAADARAKEWGLRDLMDKTKGTRPEVAEIAAAAAKVKLVTLEQNPFDSKSPAFSLKKGGELFKADPAKARELAALVGMKL